ncbi:FimV/HubP family polar landmark protein [Vibrio hangzhouensis]|uniref:Pilus assembly protein FimV n=1 Tax=Vibrio hangzhouensis TaxID=462991 RepID=A0A1H6A7Q1_9VIBR|nr:FimV/HubP family polar landmark protein [Vibrio hangzhouensis]SEG43766.1 pilus assembly protein FimV [Vibrio hangzhouensis]
MHHFFKPLLVTLALAGATTSYTISADTIRLTGPNGETLDAPQFSQPMRVLSEPEPSTPARYYGPTRKNETLWSIATKFRPTDASVQQTIYAFYQLNPGLFEQSNIHKLIPGSELRIPSAAQINRVDLQEALAILSAHQDKLTRTAVKPSQSSAKPAPKVEKVEKVQAPREAQPKTPELATKPSDETGSSQVDRIEPAPVKAQKEQPQSAVTQSEVAEDDALTKQLRDELTRSESELLSLEERNHQLRVMLTEVQNEVEVLKTEVSNEERIRTEVERQLSEEKRKQAELARLAPSQLDTLLAKPWFVALLAFVPALLIGLLVMMVMRSRKRNSDAIVAQKVTDNQSHAPEVLGAGTAAAATVAMASDVLEDDDDLFSEDLLASIDDHDRAQRDEAEASPEEDIFADLNESDFDFNLDDDEEDPFASIGDDGDLDIGFVDLDASNNGISVKDGEKALGLEEMERALNDVAVPNDDDEDLDLNLSDNEIDAEPVSQQELDDLFADFNQSMEPKVSETKSPEPQPALNQAQMDELLAGDDFDLESDDFSFDEIKLDEPAQHAEQTVPFEDTTVDSNDIDDLFAQFSQIGSDLSEESDDAQAAGDDKDIALLDEMLDEDFELSSLDNSDLMLDEMVADDDDKDEYFDVASEQTDSDDIQLLADDDFEIDENSTELLDELLFEDALAVAKPRDEQDSLALDPFSSDELLAADIGEEASSEALAAIPPQDEQDSNNELGTAVETTPEQPQSENEVSEPEIQALMDNDLTALQDSDSESAVDDAVTSTESPNAMDDSVDVVEAAPFVDDVDTLIQEASVQSVQKDLDSVVSEPMGEKVGADTEVTDSELAATPPELNVSSAPYGEEHLAPLATAEQAFDFNPEIDSSGELGPQDSDSELQQQELNALVANEFGLPSDDDWLVNDAEEAASKESEERAEPVSEVLVEEETDDDFLANALQSEYSEAHAFADAEGDIEADDVPEQVHDSAFELTDNELPEYSEDDALADAISDGVEPQAEQVEESQSAEVASSSLDDITLPDLEVSASGDTENPANDTEITAEREPIEDIEFPEYTEEDALADSEDLAHESALSIEEVAVDESSLDEAISLEDLPVYDESQAAAELDDAVALVDTKPMVFGEQEMVGETLNHSEIDALADAFSMVDMSAIEQEGQLDELLKEGEQAFSNISPVDQTTADSAGLDLDTMLQESSTQEGGEDWNGFTLTEEQKASIDSDIPDEEQVIWSEGSAGALADASDEDWGSQDPDTDFESKEHQFMTIDELMAQVDDDSASDKEEEELKLDVGLDEFPDVIGPISDVDVDSDSEAAGNLDLAKIYIEMNDLDGAVKLLERAMLEGSGKIESEAKTLLSKLSEYQ